MLLPVLESDLDVGLEPEAGLKLAARCIGTQLQCALSEAALKLATLYTGIFRCGSKQGSSDQCG